VFQSCHPVEKGIAGEYCEPIRFLQPAGHGAGKIPDLAGLEKAVARTNSIL
jgi:hypothetical protein